MKSYKDVMMDGCKDEGKGGGRGCAAVDSIHTYFHHSHQRQIVKSLFFIYNSLHLKCQIKLWWIDSFSDSGLGGRDTVTFWMGGVQFDGVAFS